MAMAMSAERSSSSYFCLICSNENFITNDYQRNEEVIPFSDEYGRTEVGGSPLIFDNEFGNNTMSISANKSINGTSDISCVSEYWYENGDNPAVFYGQSPDTTVDKTPNIPWEKKKNKKVEKCIKDLTRELLI
ncbi:hypothetical protein RIR_jg22169.t2 [Rhizophagus irregularis DAOM 181602=DAOM 197198]|nr:hypothetical protein RIR_jg22169.t2 [Rhizophagus irregularis DAOM 181602=DAOM 197198]